MSSGRWLPTGVRTTNGAVCLIAGLYLLAVALLPFAHHDVVCHAKSSTHCTTCVVGGSAESGGDAVPLNRGSLADAGSAIGLAAAAAGSFAADPSIGRAPPRLA